MTKAAEQHLSRARDYVARGEEFYRKAAEEIVAAQTTDPTLSNREIGEWFGRSHTWVQDIVRWSTSGKSTRGLEGASTPYAEQSGAVAKRHAKSVLRDADDETLGELMEALPAERRAAVVRAAVPSPERVPVEKTGPTFIDLLVRVSGALIELEAMVGGWQNPSAIPAEFSRESFNDIVAKVLRIQDHFDEMVEAVDDEDEFQKIVRNFRVVADVR